MKIIFKWISVVACSIALTFQGGALESFAAKSSAQVNQQQKSNRMLVIQYENMLTTQQLNRLGVSVVQQFPSLKYIVVKVKGENVEKVVAALRQLEDVKEVHMSPTYTTANEIVDPYAFKQKYHQTLQTNKAQMLAGTKKVKVAVIDTGVDYSNPDLKGKIAKTYNVANPMNAVTKMAHGSHVAAIIAGEKNNGVGGYGVAPNAQIYAYDVFDGKEETSDYLIAKAVLKAIEDDVDVINMSLQGSTPSTILQASINKAQQKNITIVAAAGNAGNTDAVYPAKYAGVISVGAVTSKNKRASFSSYGASLDLVAPGTNIYSASYSLEDKTTFEKMDGTSMAAPIVSATAALMIAKYKGITAKEIEYVLKHSSKDLGTKGYDTKYGFGLVQPVKALNFDRKKVPAQTTKKQTVAQLKKNAQNMSFDTNKKLTFKKASEQKTFKKAVKAGEYVQLKLTGAKNNDFQMTVRFVNNKQTKKYVVNDTLEGVQEGKLLKVPYDSTMYVTVEEVNNNYDDVTKQVTATLYVKKYKTLSKNDAPYENPIPLHEKQQTKVHYLSNGTKYDADYYTYKATSNRTVQVSINGIAGIDSTINIFDKDNLTMANEDGSSIDLPIEEGIPDVQMNTNGTSVGERAVFQAEKGKTYIVQVTNQLPEEASILGLNNTTALMKKPVNSMIGYKVTTQSKKMVKDEDHFTATAEEAFLMDNTTEKDDYAYSQFLNSFAQKSGQTKPMVGAFQSREDVDLYKFKAASSQLIEWRATLKDGETPHMAIAQLKKDTVHKKTTYTVQEITSNENLTTFKTESKLQAYVEKGQTYYFYVAPNYSSEYISYNNYKVQPTVIAGNVQDRYENNDTTTNAKVLEIGKKITANFAKGADVDYFKVKPNKSATYSVLFNAAKKPTKWPANVLATPAAVVQIAEDTNKNNVIDPSEMENTFTMASERLDGLNVGSLKLSKGKTYFVALISQVDATNKLSLWPYEFQIKQTKTKATDEDRQSVVKNNVPSKPLSLKKISTHKMKATGYFQSGYRAGDKDWYKYTVKKKGQVKIKLKTGVENDAKVEVYKNHQRIKVSDLYSLGDAEVLYLNMTKGTYYIKVSDAKKHASIHRYELTISK